MYGEEKEERKCKTNCGRAVLKVNETNKIRGLFRIMNEIPGSYNEKEFRIRKEVEKGRGQWGNVMDVLSADEVGPLIGMRLNLGKWKISPVRLVN